jgi:hypothetical protein
VKVLQIKYANFWELPIATWNINVDRDGGNWIEYHSFIIEIALLMFQKPSSAHNVEECNAIHAIKKCPNYSPTINKEKKRQN